MVIQKVKKGLLKDNVFLQVPQNKSWENAQLLSNIKFTWFSAKIIIAPLNHHQR